MKKADPGWGLLSLLVSAQIFCYFSYGNESDH